jgi:hypothetical protein
MIEIELRNPDLSQKSATEEIYKKVIIISHGNRQRE